MAIMETAKPQGVQTTQPKIQIARPRTNTRLFFSIVPEFAPADERSKIRRTPTGSRGVYRVTFILGIPGKQIFYSDLDFAQLLASGESLLLEPNGRTLKVEIFNEKDRAEVLFIPNDQGIFAKAQMRVTAEDFRQARNTAIDLIMPILSWWSYEYDVALDVVGHQILEEATESVNYGFGVIGQTKAIGVPVGAWSNPEYRAVLSAYREAVNALNVFYQFLCFYRVVEGVKHLRDRRRKATLMSGAPYREPDNERIALADAILDVDPDERQRFLPYLGMKFTRVLDEMREVLRNAAAHLDPTQDLVADKAEDLTKCEEAIPVIRYISRAMLRHEIEADPELHRKPPEGG